MAKGIDQGTAIALIKGLGGSASADAAQAAQEAQAAQAAAEIAQSAAEAALANIPSDYSELSDDVSSLKSQITQKANIDGYYESMTVGNADQLLSAKGLTDKVPYLFRRSGGNGANRAKEQGIVGGTIAWNQLAEKRDALQTQTVNGVTFTYNSTNNTITIDGTASENAKLDLTKHTVNIKAGHVYFLPPFTGLTKYQYFINGNLANYAGISKPSSDDASRWVEIRIAKNTTASNIVVKCDPMVIDLTAALTPAIADYIYNLEQATAGAGVAKLHEWGLFIKDYYEYDAGSLQSVQVAAKRTVGFNQFDKDSLGLVNKTFDGQEWQANVMTENYMPVVPGETYCWHDDLNAAGRYVRLYETTTSAHLSHTAWYTNEDIEFTVPANAHYARFMWYYDNGISVNDVMNGNVCINLSSDRNGEYEPYDEHVYPLDDSLTLRGIPKLDAANNLYYDGDTYESNGTATRRYGVVDLGTLTYNYNSELTGVDRFVCTISDIFQRQFDYVPNVSCAKFVSDSVVHANANFSTNIVGQITNNLWFYVPAGVYADRDAFKAAMSGVYIVYEKATPTTETADPYQETQLLDPYGTEEYIDAAVTASTPTRDVAIPVGHETYYPENASEKLAGLPWDFSTLIANTEKGFTATKPYSVNDFLIVNNQLYRVTASIANGATITPNTNVTATTLGAQITALLNA